MFINTLGESAAFNDFQSKDVKYVAYRINVRHTNTYFSRVFCVLRSNLSFRPCGIDSLKLPFW